MILMGLVSMGLFIGMPYLMENSTSSAYPLTLQTIPNHTAVDPELRAEFEEHQRKSPVNAVMGGSQAADSPLGGFDMAAYLAGASKKDTGSAGKGQAKR